ncbi:MAG TPA: NAD-dependent epimerase/dehydratase family protein [Solirubrobacter sp.]|nr:NAD-dependent epimerase/dehydratase family protein [Solirubrobacter sp.]
MTRVFLTGGSGLVGGALAAGLVAQGDEVVALARSDEAAAKLRAHGTTPVRAELMDEEDLARAIDGCELVYHVAGVNTMCPKDPEGMMDVNVRGARIAVRAAARAGARRVILTSSSAAIGEAEGTVGTEASPHRGSYMSVYERSKREGELAAFEEAERAGIELVAINPSSVQGPGRAGGTGRILLGYLNGKLRVFVRTRLSLVDIDDCVRAHLLGAERGQPGERYLISGATLTSQEALDLVSEIAGVRHRVVFVPGAVALAVGVNVARIARARGKTPPVCREMIVTMLHGHHYDGSRATRELGLEYTPIEQTFRRTIEWARGAGLVSVPAPAG